MSNIIEFDRHIFRRARKLDSLLALWKLWEIQSSILVVLGLAVGKEHYKIRHCSNQRGIQAQIEMKAIAS